LTFSDPFYAFIIGITEGDSLGVWFKEDLYSFAGRFEGKSKLPLDHFRRLERRPITNAEVEVRRGVRVGRIWRLTLDENLRIPLPYSILGYRPGSVYISGVLEFSEWRLGNRNLRVLVNDEVSVMPVTDLVIFRLDTGWIVLDVHGWLDKLLGGKLDDCWTQGFAICRQDGEIRTLSLSYSRDHRPLRAHGMDRLTRFWVVPREGTLSHIWQYER
jgi:hypothetical protein